MTDTRLDLPKIIASHKLWLVGDAKGYRANLSGANLSRANLIVGGNRSDGYSFFLIKEPDGKLMVRAGCRYLSIKDAGKHWKDTRFGTRLGLESLSIVKHLEAMAKIAGWMDAPVAKEAA